MNRIALPFSVFIAIASMVASASPVVSDVSYVQKTDRAVVVSYALAGDDAIVTADVLTNGVSIGEENVAGLAGDVNRVVESGGRSFTWRPDKSWPGMRFADDVVQFRLKAWSRRRPPAYMVVDLAGKDGVRYFTSTNALPYGGLTNDLYRSRYMALRRIDAAGVPWTMGESLLTNGDATNPSHPCALTNDFYIGVFEVTQGQWKQLMGDYPAKALYVSDDRAGHPAEGVCYVDMRGAGAYWPAPPAAGSFLHAMRTMAGGDFAFDLPSEAQWEFAARANHFGKRNGDGSSHEKANLLRLANYSASGTWTTVRVGSLAPNDWGLYDVQGNVWEWCLDWKWTDAAHTVSNVWGEICTDVSTSNGFVVRGGCFYSGDADIRLARRGGAAETNREQGSRGFRVAAPIR